MPIKEQTLKLIDELKATCTSYGMGNDGNEYKIITQVFLYKFLNDKFGYEIKRAYSDIAPRIREAPNGKRLMPSLQMRKDCSCKGHSLLRCPP